MAKHKPTYITLAELIGESAGSEAADSVLDNLEALASNTLPDGWEKIKVLNLTMTDLFGEDNLIETQVLNKLRFALPTVGIARAFDPEATCLNEKNYRNQKVFLLCSSFCRALITSPPALVNKIRGSPARADEFHAFIKPVKHLFISRVEADLQLKAEAEAADVNREEPTRSNGIDTEPTGKRSRIDDLESKMITMFKKLSDRIDKIERLNKNERIEEDSGSNEENDGTEVSEKVEVNWMLNSDSGQVQEDSITDSGKVPEDTTSDSQTNDCESLVPEPSPSIRTLGISCQKLGSKSWNQSGYQRLEKKLEASPIFDTLKINSQLDSITPKDSNQTILANADKSLGTIAHGLLLQREQLSLALRKLITKHPQIRDDVKDIFLSESAFKSVANDLLRYTCARRAEIIGFRRAAYKPKDSQLAAKLADIPPSESHLFEDKALTELIKVQGGIRNVFIQEKQQLRNNEIRNAVEGTSSKMEICKILNVVGNQADISVDENKLDDTDTISNSSDSGEKRSAPTNLTSPVAKRQCTSTKVISYKLSDGSIIAPTNRQSIVKDTS